MSPKLNKKKLLFKGVISLAFFAILFSFVRKEQLIEHFSQVNWWYLFLSFVLSPLMIVVSCLKWKMILDIGKVKVPFVTLFRIYLIGYFFSNLLPSTVGGDVVRSYYAGKIVRDQSFSAISIFIERFSGIFFLFFLVIFAPLIRPSLYGSPYVAVPAMAAFVLIGITFWVGRVKNPHLFAGKIISIIIGLVGKTAQTFAPRKKDGLLDMFAKYQQTIVDRIQQLHHKLGLALLTIKKDRTLLVKLFLVTALFYFFTWVNVSLAFLSFGVEHRFLDICALVPTILFIAHFPVSLFGNAGFFESVFAGYLTFIGMELSASLAMGLLLRVKVLCIGVVGFFVYMVYKQQTGDDAKTITTGEGA